MFSMQEILSTVSIHSFNCRGLQEKHKRILLFNWLKKYQGIIFLQETHCSRAHELTWKREWGGDIIFSHGTTNSRGVAVLIPKSLESDIKVKKCHTDTAGRIILIDCSIKDNSIILINIYAPTKDKPTEQLNFLHILKGLVDKYSDKAIILGGDFNTYLDTSIDKLGGKNELKSPYSENIDGLCKEFSLIDIWRIRHKNQPGFTHRQRHKTGYVQSRLDFWLISSHMEYLVRNVKVAPGFRSDHSIIILQLDLLNTLKRGRGLWKFNKDLLTDLEYVSQIKKLIKNIRETINWTNKNTLWDYVKCEIRSKTIIYSSNKAKVQRQYESNLTKKLNSLEQNASTDSAIYCQYLEVKQEWENLNSKNCKAFILRSKAKWIEEGEKTPTTF